MRRSLSTNEKAFRICREEGVNTRGYFMVGYYDAVPQDIEQMIDFAAGLGLDWASFSVSALPATDLYNVAQERGYVNGDFWKQYTIDGGRNMLFLNWKPKHLVQSNFVHIVPKAI